ncbi:hypothetical protein N7491_002550 [Penicillium cf. griseofulvum]|uniref:Uncharacterized protein n=1 Tax=Penicillium cf. griseofulvum TaxID=2972120 RepID=A0A9W9MSR9_9EURO|nr:hypothetical protein N7472_003264 [Penicillium cf. griseofulvum]KAJ5446468.1 hypothetical protein N7491_002550 [Penicillium cf. griseofulvum]KAJ5448209.1 hypothetical protein N7445_003030 [Penicillium cf. griseofulvum]
MANHTSYTQLGVDVNSHLDYCKGGQWHWDSWRVGYEPRALFTTLSAEYNTIKWPISEPNAWHSDVKEILGEANNKDEFLARLKERQEKRSRESQQAWEKIKEWLGDPHHWDNPPDGDILWIRFLRFCRFGSYDHFINYFGTYEKYPSSTQPQLSNIIETHPAKPPQPKKKAKGNMAASSGVAKSSSKASKVKPERDSSEQGGVQPKKKGKEKMAASAGVVKSSSRASKVKPGRDSGEQDGVRRSARLQKRVEQARQ